MESLISQISILKKNALEAFKNVNTLEDIADFSREFLSKQSQLSEISKSLKTLPPEHKKIIGQKVGELRQELFELHDNKLLELEKKEIACKLKKEWIDVSKKIPFKKGSLHPLSIIQKKVENIFTSMGFVIASGPEIESEWHNFDALNLSANHPARDMQDTFWINNKSQNSRENFVLRTQTSNVQIREMLKNGAPCRLIAPGRVFRNEDVDASHDAVFYQVEGLVVDKKISIAHLKGTLEIMLKKLFNKEVTVRLRPGYFPFVEPGFEVDFSCTLCKGEGCRTCKNTGWVEFMGAGMVHPNVLKNCNIDTNKYSGFAFGFGLTRLAMMMYGINDIRHLLSSKIDFLKQF